jgi:hypothetical protein
MHTKTGLKAIVLVTEFNNSVVVDEISGNVNFVDDIKSYNGWVDDIFHGMDLPTKKGFYMFKGQAELSTDMNGCIDDVTYSGEFIKIDGYKFT